MTTTTIRTALTTTTELHDALHQDADLTRRITVEFDIYPAADSRRFRGYVLHWTTAGQPYVRVGRGQLRHYVTAGERLDFGTFETFVYTTTNRFDWQVQQEAAAAAATPESITDEMKAEAQAMADDATTTMWHNGNGNSMTTGRQGHARRPWKTDDRPRCENKPHQICMSLRVNGETGRRTYRFSAGFETITCGEAEARLQAYAAEVQAIVDNSQDRIDAAAQLEALAQDDVQIQLPTNAGVVVCYGGGVDSTAMLIALRDQGIRPDLITFADTGAEKPETYEQVRRMDEWLIAQDFPTVTWCKKIPLASTGYDDLAGNNLHNDTLPSLAFGMKSCSVKWKQGPQDKVITGAISGPNKCEPHQIWWDSFATATRIVKLIGYDAGPADIRRSQKVTNPKPKALKPGQKAPKPDPFAYAYPLQQLGWKREDCIARIIEEGLQVPIKSACFFCPASQKWELFWLAGKHPHLLLAALRIEHQAMVGKHSRWGSDECTYDQDWLDLVNTPAKQWPTTSITVGLGRKFAWNRWAREHNIVDADGRFIADRAKCLRISEQLKGDGGNASDDLRRCA